MKDVWLTMGPLRCLMNVPLMIFLAVQERRGKEKAAEYGKSFRKLKCRASVGLWISAFIMTSDPILGWLFTRLQQSYTNTFQTTKFTQQSATMKEYRSTRSPHRRSGTKPKLLLIGCTNNWQLIGHNGYRMSAWRRSRKEVTTRCWSAKVFVLCP